MSLTATCPDCQTSFRVRDDLAGRRVKCSQCQTTFALPTAESFAAQGGQPAANRSQPTLQERQREILGSFRGDIQPVTISMTYRLGILLVSVVMVALPLIYISLIGLVGFSVYYHAVNHVGMLQAGEGGRGTIFVFLIYLTPMVVGAIAVLFMIKPLFSRPAQRGQTRSLKPEAEPLLFAFVERICSAVGSPRPRRIDVDCNINASASLRKGLWSMLGNDLVLTIGMPLVAGLNLNQLAGVLAHEFGHFSQGAGMRLTYIIRSISFWFTRVVYQRDQLDEWLVQTARSLDLRISWVLYLAMLLVWLTRKVLWVLMMIGHAVSGFMLRQMEYDADRHEARLVGGQVFESTCRQLTVLNVAYQGAESDLGDFYRDGRLGDNLPKLIVANVDQIPAEIMTKIHESIDQSTSSLLDTHPADKDRIASAYRENTEGVFHSSQPASALFTDFDQLARNVTWDYYREIFGKQFKPTQMHATDDLLARQEKEQQARKAVQRYFQGAFNLLRPLTLPHFQTAAPPEPQKILAEMKQTRQQMLAGLASYTQEFSAYDEADTRIIETEQALALTRSNFRLSAGNFDFPVKSQTTIAQASRTAEGKKSQIGARMESFEQFARHRMSSALQLVYLPQIAAKLSDPTGFPGECKRLLEVLKVISTNYRSFLNLRDTRAALHVLCMHLEGNEENTSLIDSIKSYMERASALIADLRKVFSLVDYPFDHAKGPLKVSRYLLTDPPISDDLGSVYEGAEEVLDKLQALYVRIVSRLAMIAEEVETACGLPQLEIPKEAVSDPATADAS